MKTLGRMAACLFGVAMLALVACGQQAPTGYAPKETFARDLKVAPPPAAPVSSAEAPASTESAPQPMDTEAYDRIYENPFLAVTQNPLSTFAVDVDTASYSNMRRFLKEGRLPAKDAVRIEELVNYFDYDYPPPAGADPFAVRTLVSECPWNKKHRLLRIALKGKEVPAQERPSGNLVFLLDVSGSMNAPNKLPLLRRAMKLLVKKLDEKDRVAIVVYAGDSGVALPSTTCGGESKALIMAALDQLQAGGSTHGSAGIQLAYQVAQEHFIKGGINRVILATDGDFNIGVTDQGSLTRLIEEKAKSGVFLTVLGFGMGNLKDATMENLADKGNGSYAYLDNITEARKVLVEEMSGTLITIAKDVKIQVEFNPAVVGAYRLIGYENRLLRAEDFSDDTKDAGEIGAGHTVTALYELVPAGQPVNIPGVDPLKYQQAGSTTQAAESGEPATLKLRYKEPDGQASRLLTFTVKDEGGTLEGAPRDFKFAAAVAGFGMLLRDSKYKGEADYGRVIDLALSGKGEDPFGYRSEFITLVRNAKELSAP